MRDLSKRFGDTVAVDQLSLTVERGEILALLGDNGAGKSTLIKLLAGVCQADCGSILLNGQRIDYDQDGRLAFIHQDLGLIDDSMTVAENIALICGYQRAFGLINWRATREAGRTSELSPTERSFVAIAGHSHRPRPERESLNS